MRCCKMAYRRRGYRSRFRGFRRRFRSYTGRRGRPGRRSRRVVAARPRRIGYRM